MGGAQQAKELPQMPTTTQTAPFQASNLKGDLGFAYVFSPEKMRLALHDALDIYSLGVVPLMGDLAQSGSDVIRVTDVSGTGWALPMAPLATETSAVAPSTAISGYESITCGTYGVSHSETYSAQAFARPEAAGLSLDALIAQVPASFLATFRANVCAAGAGITGSVGAATTTLGVDDWLDLGTAFSTALGSKRPIAMVHSTPFDQLKRAFRNEPALQNSAQEFAALMGVKTQDDGTIQQSFPNWLGLGIDAYVTDAVTDVGGAYQSFAFSPGGIGWARCSTQPIKTANPQSTMYIPDYGLIIEELSEGGSTNTRQYKALAWFGVALGSARVYTHSRILSTT